MEINGKVIPFSPVTEFVGVLRSTEENNPSNMSRIVAHKRALASLLHTRNSRGYRGNPAISVLLEKLYGLHIILFGIATLIVSD